MKPIREVVLVLIGVALLVALVASRPGSTRVSASPPDGDLAVLHVYDGTGKLVGPVALPRVVKTAEQWRSQLSAEQYRILREAGTERAFTGSLLETTDEGVYVCAGCRLPLFASAAKFKSGTGWPSYYAPVAESNVGERDDRSYGMVRTEIVCARCDGHLGHVFRDGPPPTGLRYCVNSASLAFAPSAELAGLADPGLDAGPAADGAPAPKQATAVLAGGCFWCVEAVFEEIEGVLVVRSGYAGGSPRDANYAAVSAGRTGHAEAVQVIYDPSIIGYEDLLDVHFRAAHDPTQLNRQGNDRGPQYRSAIFYADEQQQAAARSVIDRLTREGVYDAPIVTTLEPLTEFHVAEEYHQDYVRRHPGDGYVRAVALPKVKKARKLFPDRLKTPPDAP